MMDGDEPRWIYYTLLALVFALGLYLGKHHAIKEFRYYEEVQAVTREQGLVINKSGRWVVSYCAKYGIKLPTTYGATRR